MMINVKGNDKSRKVNCQYTVQICTIHIHTDTHSEGKRENGKTTTTSASPIKENPLRQNSYQRLKMNREVDRQIHGEEGARGIVKGLGNSL